MMITIGVSAAKTHFSALLEHVAAGEEVTLTRHGKPVARLVGTHSIERMRADQAIEALKALREGTTLGGLSWKALRDEGRR
jgi:prevent-host-death family protein